MQIRENPPESTMCIYDIYIYDDIWFLWEILDFLMPDQSSFTPG